MSLGIHGQVFPASAAAAIRQQVATRTGLPQLSTDATGGLAGDRHMQCYTGRFMDDGSDLVLRWLNVIPVNGTPSLLDPGLTGVTIKAAIKINGVRYPVNFPAGRNGYCPSDGELIALPIGVSWKRGDAWMIRQFTVCDSAPARWPLTTRYNDDCWNVFGSNATDEVDSDSFYYSRQTNFMVLPPYQITGIGTKKRAIEDMGDSISSDGSADAAVHNAGFVARGLTQAYHPFLNNGASGNSLTYQVQDYGATPAQRARRNKGHANSATLATFCGLVTNDIANGRSDTDIRSMQMAQQTECANNGGKLVTMTCPPRTNAANNAKADGDSATAFSTTRPNYNAATRNGNGVGHGYFDTAAHTEAGSTGLWRTDITEASGVTIVNAGTGYQFADLIDFDYGLQLQVTGTDANGGVTSLGIQSKGGFDTATPGNLVQLFAERGGNAGGPTLLSLGSGLVVSVNGFTAASPTADGVHPSAAMQCFLTKKMREFALNGGFNQ